MPAGGNDAYSFMLPRTKVTWILGIWAIIPTCSMHFPHALRCYWLTTTCSALWRTESAPGASSVKSLDCRQRGYAATTPARKTTAARSESELRPLQSLTTVVLVMRFTLKSGFGPLIVRRLPIHALENRRLWNDKVRASHACESSEQKARAQSFPTETFDHILAAEYYSRNNQNNLFPETWILAKR